MTPKSERAVGKIEALIKKAHDMREWKGNWVFSLCARLILGAVFIYASINKIAYPAAFAEAVYNYQILPDALINLTAIILPWVELILGVLLVLGIWLPGSVLLSNLLLLIFLSALVFNLARGLDVQCGCFSTIQEGGNNVPAAWYVFRDGLFLLPAFYLFHYTFRGKRRPESG
ncbi:MAG: MauE/DoxX family redox-associated membrane protein [Pseudomonadota bacterium]